MTRRNVDWRRRAALASTATLLVAALAAALPGGDVLKRPAGPAPDGRTGVTPNNWKVTPAGTKVRVGATPMWMIASPDGGKLLLSNDGYGQQSIQLLDRATLTVEQTIPYDSPESVFIGLAWTRDGKRVYASGGHQNLVRVYDVAAGVLTETAPIVLGTPRRNGFATGLALSLDERTLFVANHRSGDVAFIDTATQTVIARLPLGAGSDPYDASKFPYGVLPAPDGQRLFVTNWKQGTLAVVDISDAAAPRLLGETRVGDHPNALLLSPDRTRLFVANANSDSVSVVDSATAAVLFTIDLRLYEGAPFGSTPSGLAISPDGRTLYVANAGENAVAVVDLAQGKGAAAPYRVRGRIPTGWYPTAVLLSAAGDTLYVANSKDVGLGQNAYPPVYVGDQMFGSISAIPVPDDTTLAGYTRAVYENAFRQLAPAIAPGGVAAAGRAPLPPTQYLQNSLLARLPIEHVVYIIKENRTYDQVFGDLPGGNGDASLLMFDDRTAPNHRRLAQEYVLLDNTYCDAEISKDGHERSTAANVTDYTMKVWPSDYSGRGNLINRALTAITNAPGGYLWDAAQKAGITYRAYGEYVINGRKYANGTYDPCTTRMPALEGHFAPMYRTYDLAHLDVARAAVWLEEFEGYKANGGFPQLSIISLPNDHLAGTDPGYPTPNAMMADNDLALGRIVDAISHSPYWKSTAIFVIEDDTQDGVDHVDSHRTPALVISPWVRRHAVDSTHYSTVSMVRSAEVILGLPALSIYDATALPMDSCFTTTPDFTPYSHVVPEQPLDEMNPALSELTGEARRLAELSTTLELDEMDEADPKLMNEILWKTLKGTAPPQR